MRLFIMKHTVNYMMNTPKSGGLSHIGIIEEKEDYFSIKYMTKEELEELQNSQPVE